MQLTCASVEDLIGNPQHAAAHPSSRGADCRGLLTSSSQASAWGTATCQSCNSNMLVIPYQAMTTAQAMPPHTAAQGSVQAPRSSQHCPTPGAACRAAQYLSRRNCPVVPGPGGAAQATCCLIPQPDTNLVKVGFGGGDSPLPLLVCASCLCDVHGHAQLAEGFEALHVPHYLPQDKPAASVEQG